MQHALMMASILIGSCGLMSRQCIAHNRREVSPSLDGSYRVIHNYFVSRASGKQRGAEVGIRDLITWQSQRPLVGVLR